MIRGRLFTATSSCWVRSGGCGLGRPQGLGGPFQAAYRTISQWNCRPVHFEAVFLVPIRYADQLAGVALVDDSTAARTPVITPPAP